MTSQRQLWPLTALLAVTLAACAALPGAEPAVDAVPANALNATAPTLTPLPVQPTVVSEIPAGPPTPTPIGAGPAPLRAVWSGACDPVGFTTWCLLGEGDPRSLTLPTEGAQFMDYAPATHRVLYASHFPDRGAGPGNLAVSDLWWLDLESGETVPLVEDDLVIQAAFAPNGLDVAYIIATLETYELRWRSASGEDRLLAVDVPVEFGISPSGAAVAFTRESGYEVVSSPGIYVVDVASGLERQLSDADGAGQGSISDHPVWSPDEQQILVRVQNDMLRVAVDGSSRAFLAYDPALSDEVWFDAQLESVLWHPDGTHVVASALIADPDAFLLNVVLLLELDPALERIVGGSVVAERGFPIGWHVPGQSLWVAWEEAGRSPSSVALP